jgi:hypothetical protein
MGGQGTEWVKIPWKKETGAILLFCPGHHMRLQHNRKGREIEITE